MRLYTVTYIHEGIEKVEEIAASSLFDARMKILLRKPGIKLTGILPIKEKKR
jgi:hypothetical protein